MMTKYQNACTPGYYNGEGKGGRGEGFLEGQYPAGPVPFYQMLEKWRDAGSLEGLATR